MHKGGLFGSDYRMLFPGDGIDGIKRFYLDTLIGFGRRGLACQPAIVGVGLGGSKDICMVLGKQASCLRTVGSRNPDPEDRRAGGGVQGARQQHRHGRHGLHGLVDGGRLPHRGRLLPYRRHADERAHVLPVLAPRHARGFLPTAAPSSAPTRVVHRLHAAVDGGMGPTSGARRRSRCNGRAEDRSA